MKKFDVIVKAADGTEKCVDFVHAQNKKQAQVLAVRLWYREIDPTSEQLIVKTATKSKLHYGVRR